jgi:two-component system nitrate/nitrite sensor histidine kinase NarX
LVVQDDETQNPYYLMMVTDITEQKREEHAALRLAVSHERERLARDLHDAVSQSLFASLIIAEALPRLWEHSPERAYAELVHLQQLNRGALAEMRTLLLDLRPETVLETEFETLLNQLAAALQSQRDITVVIQVPPHLSLPPEVKVVLYRITQEALNNVAKYAQSHQVTIRLVQNLAQLELCITDDGQGFDPNNVSTGFGLKIMQERAEAIGATLHIMSQLKQGTSVTVVWPLS